MIRIIERVKCAKCNVTFGRTKTGRAWIYRRAFHMIRVHGVDFDTEMDRLYNGGQ